MSVTGAVKKNKYNKWHSIDEKPPKGMWFDLVEVRDSQGKVQKAWYTGTSWDCLRRTIGVFKEWKPLMN